MDIGLDTSGQEPTNLDQDNKQRFKSPHEDRNGNSRTSHYIMC